MAEKASDMVSANCGTNHNATKTTTDSKDKKRQGKYNLRKKTITTRVKTEERLASPKMPKPKSRPPPLSKYRRKAANTRERTRMKEINTAFYQLQTALPVPGLVDETAKMSTVTKITTLRLAVNYIAALRKILGDDNNEVKGALPELMDSDNSEETQTNPGTSENGLVNSLNDSISGNFQGSTVSGTVSECSTHQSSVFSSHQVKSVPDLSHFPVETLPAPGEVPEVTSCDLGTESRTSRHLQSAITELMEPATTLIRDTDLHLGAQTHQLSSAGLNIEDHTRDEMETDLDPETSSWLQDQLRDEILKGLNSTMALLGGSVDNSSRANELMLHTSPDEQEDDDSTDLFDADSTDKPSASDLETLYNSCITSLNKDINSYEYGDQFPISPNLDNSSVDLNNNVFQLVSHGSKLGCDFIAASQRS